MIVPGLNREPAVLRAIIQGLAIGYFAVVGVVVLAFGAYAALALCFHWFS